VSKTSSEPSEPSELRANELHKPRVPWLHDHIDRPRPSMDVTGSPLPSRSELELRLHEYVLSPFRFNDGGLVRFLDHAIAIHKFDRPAVRKAVDLMLNRVACDLGR
jgi:hypothetical protein